MRVAATFIRLRGEPGCSGGAGGTGTLLVGAAGSEGLAVSAADRDVVFLLLRRDRPDHRVQHLGVGDGQDGAVSVNADVGNADIGDDTFDLPAERAGPEPDLVP